MSIHDTWMVLLNNSVGLTYFVFTKYIRWHQIQSKLNISVADALDVDEWRHQFGRWFCEIICLFEHVDAPQVLNLNRNVMLCWIFYVQFTVIQITTCFYKKTKIIVLFTSLKWWHWYRLYSICNCLESAIVLPPSEMLPFMAPCCM